MRIEPWINRTVITWKSPLQYWHEQDWSCKPRGQYETLINFHWAIIGVPKCCSPSWHTSATQKISKNQDRCLHSSYAVWLQVTSLCFWLQFEQQRYLHYDCLRVHKSEIYSHSTPSRRHLPTLDVHMMWYILFAISISLAQITGVQRRTHLNTVTRFSPSTTFSE